MAALRALAEVPNFFLHYYQPTIWAKSERAFEDLGKKSCYLRPFLLVGEHSHSDVPDLVPPVVHGV